MTHSIAVARLLRRLTTTDAPAPEQDWTQTIETVRTQLHVRPDLAAGAVHALDRLLRLLQVERQAHADVARELAEVASRLAATEAALAKARHQERQARHSALHDGLTALPNRAYFRSRLDEALRLVGGNGALAVLVLDLDGFKAVNDTHGHAVGDELLKVVAARLSHAVRGSDWVGRLGGDEFACVLTGVRGRERVQGLAGALYDAISAPIAVGALRLHVRPSIGIAVHDGTADCDTLIHRADAAMFAAKRSRAGPTFCDD